MSIQLVNASPEKYLMSFGKHVTLVTAAIAADVLLSEKITIWSVNLGFCLGNFVPRTGKSWFRYIGNSLGTLNANIGSIFSSNDIYAKIIIPSLCEEVEFRWLFQEVLLRKLPKAILQKIPPDLTRLVDSLPARISRIAAVSLLFTLCHAHTLECPQGGGIDQLLGGLLYGTIHEVTGSLSACVSMHVLYNLFDTIVNGSAEI